MDLPFETQLQRAFRSGLHLGERVNYDSLHFASSPEWDSIAHMQLIAAIEGEFGIVIDTSDMLAMNSYEKAREIVRKYHP